MGNLGGGVLKEENQLVFFLCTIIVKPNYELNLALQLKVNEHTSLIHAKGSF